MLQKHINLITQWNKITNFAKQFVTTIGFITE